MTPDSLKKEMRNDLREGDDVIIHIRGTLEGIKNHGTSDNPRWVADVQTRSGWHSVPQEDVTPYAGAPDPLSHIRAVHERFRCVGPVLEGIDYDTDPIHCAARDMWLAIKADILAADIGEEEP